MQSLAPPFHVKSNLRATRKVPADTGTYRRADPSQQTVRYRQNRNEIRRTWAASQLWQARAEWTDEQIPATQPYWLCRKISC